MMAIAYDLRAKVRQADNGGPPGDLYVDINVRPHAIFQREGSDLRCDVPISFSTAALGGSIEVPTLDGPGRIEDPIR